MQRIIKVATAGSVDDGKSTLLARLLLDTGSLPVDLRPKDSNPGSLANLLDGLELERQQGITIDVAHRFFDDGRIRFHLMDSPGHEQYTRNMATAAAGADALLLLISANEGVKTQSLNHLRVAKLVGVTRFIIAVNKLDLVRNRAAVFAQIQQEVRAELDDSEAHVEFVGVIATTGENVVTSSKRLSFDKEQSLLGALQGLDTGSTRTIKSGHQEETVVSIQDVFRGKQRQYFAELAAGELSQGQTLFLSGTSLRCTISNLLVSGSPSEKATRGSQLSFQIAEDRDIARGDLLTASQTEKSTTFTANLVWLDATPGYLKRRYFLQVGQQKVSCRISKIKSVESEIAATGGSKSELIINSISRVEIVATSPVFIDINPAASLNNLILIDPETANTCAAGKVIQEQRRSQNLFTHGFEIDSRKVAAGLGFQGKVVWLTGLSGSGKSTVANALAIELASRGSLFSIVDGDALRQGLNQDLGFTNADRVENIRRAAEVAKLQVASGLVTIVALVSPFRADRDDAREIIGTSDFLEVFIDAPLGVCEQRDPKGLYKKARAGKIPNFTGIDSPYEPPTSPEIRIDTTQTSPVEAAKQIISLLQADQAGS
jgi:bifunctional enzyme CysN/CysC